MNQRKTTRRPWYQPGGRRFSDNFVWKFQTLFWGSYENHRRSW